MSVQSTYNISQIDDKLTPAYGEIHTHSNVTPQSIPTGASYTKITQFENNGIYFGVTPDSSTDIITINSTGLYNIQGNFSMLSGTANVVVFASAFLDDVEIDNVHFSRKIAVAGDVGAASFSGLVEVTSVPAVLDFRMRHDNIGSVDITISYGNLSVYKQME